MNALNKTLGQFGLVIQNCFEFADDDDSGLCAKFPGWDGATSSVGIDRLWENFVAWSFKSVPVFVPALLVLFIETASGQPTSPATFNEPQPQVQVQQQPVNASRYPAHLTTSQRGSFGAIRQPDAAAAFSTVSHSRPQQFSPVDSVAQQQQQFLPAPNAATQFHDGPEPMNVPLQPGAWGANEVYRGNADEQFLTQPAKIPAEQLRWSFNFKNAPWPVVLRTFARECGFSLQMAVEPAGEFTYFDENQYRVTEVLDIFNDNLMTCGQILVRDGQRLMLMNATADIPGNLIPFVPIHGIDALGRNELATVAIPLKNTDPLQAIEEIRQLQSPLGQVKALTNSGRVIVTDTGSYLRRMRDLLLGSGVAAGDGQAYVYQLRHAQADEVAKAVTDFLSQNSGLGGGIPPGDGGFSNGSSDVSQKVVAEKTTNSLLIRGSSEEMATIQRIVEDLDRAPREVLVQALLVEVELGNTNELGVELGFQDSVLFDRSVVDKLVTISQTTTSPNGTQTTNQNIISQTSAPGFNFNTPGLGNNVAARPSHIASQSLSNFGVGRTNGDLGFGGLVLSAGSDSVNVLLRALDAKFNVDVLSRPQVRAVENHKAFIQIGQQVPVVDGVSITPVGTANPVIRQDQAGIILKVTPRISPDGRVQLEVTAEKSSYNLTPGTGVPIFTDATNGNVIEAPIKDITTADTTVSIQSGQTIVLGGMITNDQTIVERKVPFLGDIPLIGRLFRYDLNRHKRKELLVFLTPTVLDDDGTNESIKSKETGLINMPAEAFSFGDNLTGTYANPANVVEVPMLPLAPGANGDFGQPGANGQPGPNGQPVQNGFETGYPPPNQAAWQSQTVPVSPTEQPALPLWGHSMGQPSSQSDNTGRFALQNGNTVDESDGILPANYEVVADEYPKPRSKWFRAPDMKGLMGTKKSAKNSGPVNSSDNSTPSDSQTKTAPVRSRATR